MAALAKADIRCLLELLNDELRQSGTVGDVFLVGGARLESTAIGSMTR